MAAAANDSTDSTGQLARRSDLQSLIKNTFPPVCHAFGYGSGVFAQSGERGEQLDIVLVVENALDFHQELMERHGSRNHYSWLCKAGGPSFCANLQTNYGAKVSFHPYVSVTSGNNNQLTTMLKYGVVEKQHLLQDLHEWSFLYLAGRLHKPTLLLIEDEDIMEAQVHHNLGYALSTARLFMSSDAFAKPQLFETIASLSYAGDIRMTVGAEDPNKIHKLVHGNDLQLHRWEELYGSLMRRPDLKLPPPLRNAQNPKATLANIVKSATRVQSAKGLVTAGFGKSVMYLMAKLSKR